VCDEWEGVRKQPVIEGSQNSRQQIQQEANLSGESMQLFTRLRKKTIAETFQMNGTHLSFTEYLIRH
jgi:hypothetical protein